MSENANLNVTTETSTVPPVPTESLESQRRFLKHLTEYPLVNYTKEAAYSIPYVKQMRVSVAPSLKYVRDTQPIKLVADKTDVLGDYALNQVDKIVPGLKTFEVQEITSPVTRSVNGMVQGVQNGINEANSTLHKTIIDPSNKVVTDLKNHISASLVDKNGKTIIISHADPLILPVNDHLEKIILSYFPKTKKVSKEGHPSEVSRTFEIVYNTITGKKELVPTGESNVATEVVASA